MNIFSLVVSVSHLNFPLNNFLKSLSPLLGHDTSIFQERGAAPPVCTVLITHVFVCRDVPLISLTGRPLRLVSL